MARILSDKEVKDLTVDIISSTPELKKLPTSELKQWLDRYRIKYNDEDIKAIEDELATFYRIDVDESREAKGHLSLISESILKHINEDGSGIQSPKDLVKNKVYTWTGGAEYQDITYIGLSIKHPDKKPGSSMGKGFLFEWTGTGKYMELSMNAIRENVIEKEEELTEANSEVDRHAARLSDVHKEKMHVYIRKDGREVIVPDSEVADELKAHRGVVKKATYEKGKKVNEAGRKSIKDFPFVMHYSKDGMREAKGGNTYLELINVANVKDLEEFAIFKQAAGFHSTTQENYLVAWYDKNGNGYWSNRAKKEPDLNDRRLNDDFETNESNNSVNEGPIDGGKLENELKNLCQKYELDEISSSAFIKRIKDRLDFYPFNLARAIDTGIKGATSIDRADSLVDIISEYYGWPSDIFDEANEASDDCKPTHVCTVDLKEGAHSIISKGTEVCISDDLVVEDVEGGVICDITPEELKTNFKPIEKVDEADGAQLMNLDAKMKRDWTTDLGNDLKAGETVNIDVVEKSPGSTWNLISVRRKGKHLGYVESENWHTMFDVIGKSKYSPNYEPESVDEAKEDEAEKQRLVGVVKRLFSSIYNMRPKDRVQLFEEILKVPAGSTKDRTKTAAEMLSKQPIQYKKALKMVHPKLFKSIYEEETPKRFPMIAECNESGEMVVNPLYEALRDAKNKLEKVKITNEFEEDDLPCINAVAYIGGKRHKFSDWHLENKVVKKYYLAENGDRGAMQGIRNRLTRLGNELIQEHKSLKKELAAAKINEEAIAAKNEAKDKIQQFFDAIKKLDDAKDKKEIKRLEAEIAKLSKENGFTVDEIAQLETHVTEAVVNEENDQEYFDIESKLRDVCFEHTQGVISTEEAAKQIQDIIKDSEELSAIFTNTAPEALVDEVINYYGWTQSDLTESIHKSDGTEIACNTEFDARFKEICAGYYADLLPIADAVKQAKDIIDECGNTELAEACAGYDDESMMYAIVSHYKWNVFDLVESVTTK